MELFFTPVKGKAACINDWESTKLTQDEARRFPGATGVAIVLGLSNVVAFDLDDLEWCVKTFSNIDIDIHKELFGHFEIISPKQNRKKILFQYPDKVTLEYMNLPPKHKGSKLELRCGKRYDVWGDSEHPEGGAYTVGSAQQILPIPDTLLSFWLQCMEYKVTERNAGSGEVPLLNNSGKMSVVHIFNTQHPLEVVLRECGYLQNGNKWQSPHSESGSYGVTTQLSYLNPWDVCYSHHTSDGELSGRPIDAFEIAASFAYPKEDLDVAKIIFTKDQANKLMAVSDDTGEQLSVSVHQYNNPLGELQRDFEPPTKEAIPIFPADVLLQWPEPWPIIWKNWCRMPRVLSQELLLPTVLGVHAHMLGGDFITAYGRKPGFYFLTIAPSTAHKDGNSRDVIQNVNEALLKSGNVSLFFNQLLSYPTSITADTSFIESFRLEGTDKGHLFWLNTEATRMFQKMNSSGNDNVAALADKIIEVVDGKAISGKQKVGQDSRGIKNPNVQLLFYTQPETIEKYITEELVDSGLLGRATITMSPLKVQHSDMFMEPTKAYNEQLDNELAVFYSKFSPENGTTTVKFSDHDQLDVMREFHETCLKPMSADNDSLYKMISRLGNTAEQLFCTMVGVCHKWDDHQNVPRRKLPARAMLPLIQYWAEVKQYVVNNYVQGEIDPLASAVLDVIKDLVVGKLTLSNTMDKEIRECQGLVPRNAIAKCVKNKTKLKAKLSVSNDSKNVSARIYSIVDLLIKDGTLVEERLGSRLKPYIGVRK